MQNEDLVPIAQKTGIDAEKLKMELELFVSMPEIFGIFERNNADVGMYGGTAINKVYFGERQRLSYDIDLFCYNYDKATSIMDKSAKRIVDKGGRAAYMYKSIRLDLWKIEKTPEKPQKLEARSLLTFFGYVMPPVLVPTYSLEYLLAEKIIALAERNLLKDIYDAWVGLHIVKDRQKLRNYLMSMQRKRKVDVLFMFDSVIEKNLDWYKEKTIDAISYPEPKLMIKDVHAKLEELLG